MTSTKKAKLKPFATDEESNELAIAAIQSYIKDCHCKSPADIMRALQKVIAVGMDMHATVEHGKMERVTLN